MVANLGAILRLIDAIYWEKDGVTYEHWPSREVAYESAKWSMNELRAYHVRMTQAIKAVNWGGSV
jgi:hypothetical protein